MKALSCTTTYYRQSYGGCEPRYWLWLLRTSGPLSSISGGRGRVIKGAPLAFTLCVALIGGAIWVGMEWHYGERISTEAAKGSTQQATITLLQNRVADYQDKLHGQSPEKAAQQIRGRDYRSRLLPTWRHSGLPWAWACQKSA